MAAEPTGEPHREHDRSRFAARAKVLKELVEHHADEEEKEMFPRARQAMDAEELAELGERMAAQKGNLESGHPLSAIATLFGR